MTKAQKINSDAVEALLRNLLEANVRSNLAELRRRYMQMCDGLVHVAPRTPVHATAARAVLEILIVEFGALVRELEGLKVELERRVHRERSEHTVQN